MGPTVAIKTLLAGNNVNFLQNSWFKSILQLTWSCHYWPSMIGDWEASSAAICQVLNFQIVSKGSIKNGMDTSRTSMS